MRTIRVVLLDADQQFLYAAESSLAAKKEIRVVGALPDGRQGLTLIRRERPDVVLLGLVLLSLDGYSVLRELRRFTLPPQVIICTELYSAEAVRISRRYGAAYFLCRPIELRCLYSAILDNFNSLYAESDNKNEEVFPSSAEILRAVLAKGLSPRYSGSRYLADAVHLALERPARLGNLKQGVYAEIAAKYGVTVSSIERSLRTAIFAAYSAGTLVGFPHHCPSNRECILRLVEGFRSETPEVPKQR